jgi:dienelactone hydrolase
MAYKKSSDDPSVQRDRRKGGVMVVTLLMALALSMYGATIFAAGRAGEELSALASSIEPQKVTFASEDEDLTGGVPTILDGYVYRPDGPGPFPAIVGLHGCSGLFTAGRINARYADWGGRLAALGYIVIFPDSFGPRGIAEVCRQKDRSSFSPHRERPRDAVGALRWLQKQAIVQRERVGLMGWSNGGTTLLSTIGALSKTAGSDSFQLAIAFYPGCTKFVHKKNWQPRIPLTIFIGEVDDWTPAAPCKELVARANAEGCQADIITFPNAYHGFDHPNLPLTIRKGLAFTANGQGSARVGTDPEGRATVLEVVPKLLARYLLPVSDLEKRVF